MIQLLYEANVLFSSHNIVCFCPSATTRSELLNTILVWLMSTLVYSGGSVTENQVLTQPFINQ